MKYEIQNEISLDEQNQVSSQQSEQIENEEFQKQQKTDSIINNNEDLNSKNDEQEFIFEIPSDDEILEQVRAQIPLTKTVVENLTEIEVFVAPRAHYLITEEGVNAEIKTAKPIKGKIFKSDDGKFVFEVSPDKNGVIPAVNFEEIDINANSKESALEIVKNIIPSASKIVFIVLAPMASQVSTEM